MKQLTILVDFDQTLNNLNEAWVAYLNERHGTTVKTDDIKCWDITKAFPTLTPLMRHEQKIGMKSTN